MNVEDLSNKKFLDIGSGSGLFSLYANSLGADVMSFDNDEFSVEQESELHNKLNNILKKLNEQGFGQQIIFDEIEDLKNHFNLGKKNWFQLLKGKVVDLTFKKILNKTIVQEIYNQLSEGFEQVVKMIE
jgi:ribosomal protein L11 methylase PrmA